MARPKTSTSTSTSTTSSSLSSSVVSSTSSQKMESLQQLLRRTIKEGAPLYNQGDRQGCCELYLEAATYAVTYIEGRTSTTSGTFIAQVLQEAIREVQQVLQKHASNNNKKDNKGYTEGAWILRRTFDDLLEIRDDRGAKISTTSSISIVAPESGGSNSNTTTTNSATTPSSTNNNNNSRPAEFYRNASQVALTGKRNNTDDIENSHEEWQDEQEDNAITDLEKAQHLAHVYTILLTSAYTTTYGENDEYPDCASAIELVDILIDFGLARHRRAALDKIQSLQEAFFLTVVSPPNPNREGTTVYQFPTNELLDEKYEQLWQNQPHKVGSTNAIALLALAEFLEKTTHDDDDDYDDDINGSVYLPKSTKPLSLHRLKVAPEQHPAMEKVKDDPELVARGIQLAVVMAQIEPLLDIRDRRHSIKTYSNCFVGSDAVTALVEKHKIMPTRKKATQLMDKLLQVGFLQHVTKEHDFEDKKLFYIIVPRKELQELFNQSGQKRKNRQSHVNDDIVAESAIQERLKQVSKMSVAEILNWFYGCNGNNDANDDAKKKMNTECWDVVDLSIWRNNMKRWGFGRRMDQDDDMVDKLSPLALAIDPETWDMEAPENKEWTTPWGILAQIAIFDQVPRSAFRGTSDAFKWDALAIRATNYAIDHGYFETAYKSTLNRFVVLLPLEHSEIWKDQQRGVQLLLQMLSVVAIDDEGLSDYEIIKRLEFSKRLSTAFLEHAQVIAKFKRFPHRNKANGRTTTIEERIWLASDLVPRWAKSQQHTEEQDQQHNTQNQQPKKSNILQLPVIPLKRFTRG